MPARLVSQKVPMINCRVATTANADDGDTNGGDHAAGAGRGPGA